MRSWFWFYSFFPGFGFWGLILSSAKCPSVSVFLFPVILSKLVFSCASSFSSYFLSVGSMCACVSVYNFELVLSVFLLICLSLLVLLYIHSSLRCDPVMGLSQGYSEIFTFFIIIIINVSLIFKTSFTCLGNHMDVFSKSHCKASLYQQQWGG